MRISDWSSDVCSSDLVHHTADEKQGHQQPAAARAKGAVQYPHMQRARFAGAIVAGKELRRTSALAQADRPEWRTLIDRKRGVWGKSVSVRVGLGGTAVNKKKNKQKN